MQRAGCNESAVGQQLADAAVAGSSDADDVSAVVKAGDGQCGQILSVVRFPPQRAVHSVRVQADSVGTGRNDTLCPFESMLSERVQKRAYLAVFWKL